MLVKLLVKPYLQPFSGAADTTQPEPAAAALVCAQIHTQAGQPPLQLRCQT